MLSPSARLEIVARIKNAVLKHHFSVANLDLSAWSREVDDCRPDLLQAQTDKDFEEDIHHLLSKLKSSHLDFYRDERGPLRPEHTIGATLRSISWFDKKFWMFLDVYEDGPAARAGVIPGHLVISMNGDAVSPPALPAFRFGEKHELTIGSLNNTETRSIVMIVPERKSTRPRLPFVEPRSVSYKMLTNRVGIVKIVFFSGMFGVRFSKILDKAICSLKAQGCDRLIIDLRGCLGGSLGFARLVSYMCPGRIAIGYDVTRERQQRGYLASQLPRVRMPNTRLGVLLRLAEFSIRDKSLILLTQGLGEQPFHGHIAVLINEWTSSAGEMAAQFAKDTNAATLVGQRTAGLVLGAAMFEVGSGYKLYLPIFGWYSPNGVHTEGSGVMPDIAVDVDPIALSEGVDDQLNRALEVFQ